MAQLVRAPPCHGGGHGFEPHSGRSSTEHRRSPANNLIRDLSSAGRASALQAEGHRFEPCRSHSLQVFPKRDQLQRSGGIPEWPKGADCKSVSSAFGGSNPPSPTSGRASRQAVLFLKRPAGSLHFAERRGTIGYSKPMWLNGRAADL